MTLDMLGDLFEVDLQPQVQCAPERNLIAEVLYRALRDLLNQLQHEDDYRTRIEVSRWMRLDREFRKKDLTTPFSFVWCCTSLNLCPHVVKQKILELRNSGVRVIV